MLHQLRIKNKFLFYLYLFILQCFWFFNVDSKFCTSWFSFSLKDFFSVSCKAGLMATKSLSFACLRKSSLSLLKDNFARYRILSWLGFFFFFFLLNTSIILFYSLATCMESDVILIFAPPVKWVFPSFSEIFFKLSFFVV